MFYAIRRMIKLFLALCLLAILFWAWQQRAVFEPVFVWYEVYQNGGHTNTAVLPTIAGRATRVTDPHTFEMRERKGTYLNVRLTGLQEEPVPATPQDYIAQKPKREALEDLVLSNYVHVDITYSNQNSVLGIAYAEGTNVNAALIAQGSARLKPEYLKNVPRHTQYSLFHAGRVARKLKDMEAATE